MEPQKRERQKERRARRERRRGREKENGERERVNKQRKREGERKAWRERESDRRDREREIERDRERKRERERERQRASEGYTSQQRHHKSYKTAMMIAVVMVRMNMMTTIIITVRMTRHMTLIWHIVNKPDPWSKQYWDISLFRECCRSFWQHTWWDCGTRVHLLCT